MEIAVLLDEDTERRLAILLENGGHDVERVVDVPTLGPGSGDDAIRTYAKRTDRIIITYDDHHIEIPPREHAGVFYAPNQATKTEVLYRVIEVVLQSHPSRQSLSGIVFLSPANWLSE